MWYDTCVSRDRRRKGQLGHDNHPRLRHYSRDAKIPHSGSDTRSSGNPDDGWAMAAAPSGWIRLFGFGAIVGAGRVGPRGRAPRISRRRIKVWDYQIVWRPRWQRCGFGRKWWPLIGVKRSYGTWAGLCGVRAGQRAVYLPRLHHGRFSGQRWLGRLWLAVKMTFGKEPYQ